MTIIKIEGIIPKSFNLNRHEIDNIIKESLATLNIKNTLEIEIIFTSSQKIRELNLKYRKINKPTDVLSFPQKQFRDKGPSLLGSIIISSEMVEKKNENLQQVIKHGLLHLLGYDHEKNEKEWKNMASLINCSL
jgi:probable rRNA maturation factor